MDVHVKDDFRNRRLAAILSALRGLNETNETLE